MLRVARQHNDLPNARLSQAADGCCGRRFESVAEDEAARVLFPNRQMDHRASLFGPQGVQSHLQHHLFAAHSHLPHVGNFGHHSLAAPFAEGRDALAVHRLAVCLQQGFADGMRRGRLGQRSQFQKTSSRLGRIVRFSRMEGQHLEDALRQGARLVKHHRAHLCQGFEHVSPFH